MLRRARNAPIEAAAMLNHLRRSKAWSQPVRDIGRSALSERLDSLLVLELLADGDKNYLRLNVRGLYRHVLTAITNGALPDKMRPPTATTRASSGPAQGKVVKSVSTVPQLSEAQGVEEAGSVQGPQAPVSESDIPTCDPPSAPPKSFRQASLAVKGAVKMHGITYRERLGGHLHARDMRRLVTPFSALNEPEIIVRRHVILLNFDPLRAIILRDRLLVIVPDGADSILVDLERRVRGGNAEVEATIFGAAVPTAPPLSIRPKTILDNAKKLNFRKDSDDSLSKLSHNRQHHSEEDVLSSRGNYQKGVSETSAETDSSTWEEEEAEAHFMMKNEWDEIARHEWVDLPFELRCADAVLYVVSSILTEDTFETQERAVKYINQLLSDDRGLSDDPLTIIRAVKDALREMKSRVMGFQKSLTRTLDDEEDMALMNLSRLLTHPERFIQPVPEAVLEEESDEPELILESHLQSALTLSNAVDIMQGQIDTASELVNQKLDAVRNRLLYANMIISIVSLCVACFSAVGSMFGMNVKNPLQDTGDSTAFMHITFGTLAASLCLAILIIILLAVSGAISLTGFSSG